MNVALASLLLHYCSRTIAQMEIFYSVKCNIIQLLIIQEHDTLQIKT